MKVWLKNTFQQAAWGPLAVFIFYVVAAKVFNAYILYPWLDIPTHFFGGAAITYFYFTGIGHSQASHARLPKTVQLALPVELTAVTAIIWEILEYLSDSVLGTQMNLGPSDTLSDLFFGLLGAFVFIFIVARSGRSFSLTAKEIKGS